MVTADTLRNQTMKDLAQMAKRQGIIGWHSMRKDALIRALVCKATASSQPNREARASAAAGKERPLAEPSKRQVQPLKSLELKSEKPSAPATLRSRQSIGKVSGKPGKSLKPARLRDPRIDQRLEEDRVARQRLKDLSYSVTRPTAAGESSRKDRSILMVRDAYWLQAYWELMPSSIQRAQAALALHWHTARPVLRVIRLERGPSSTSEHVVRDIPIHGGVRNWYVHVDQPSSRYCVEIGYLASNKRFYRLVRSNMVTTPRPGSTEVLDGNWSDIAENCEKIFAMSGGYGSESNDGQLKELLEERLRRPIGRAAHKSFGAGARSDGPRERPFAVQVNAEMIVYGITKPGAFVTMGGEPVKLRSDGTFTARVDLPERRQVVPIVASSADGTDEQTVVLAVERNTKVMEPVVRHAGEE